MLRRHKLKLIRLHIQPLRERMPTWLLLASTLNSQGMLNLPCTLQTLFIRLLGTMAIWRHPTDPRQVSTAQ